MYIYWKWEMTFKIRCGGNLFFGSVVGFADDFGLGCDLGFVCIWSLFVIWVYVCVWSLFLFLFFFSFVLLWSGCVYVWSLFLSSSFFRLCCCDLGLSYWLLGLCSCNLGWVLHCWVWLGWTWRTSCNVLMKINNYK